MFGGRQKSGAKKTIDKAKALYQQLSENVSLGDS